MNLDHLVVGGKAVLLRAVADGSRYSGVVHFRHLVALRADQELAAVFIAGVSAAGVGVEAFDAVNETMFQQKIQRPVDRGRRAVKAFCAQLFQNSVGPHRFVAVPYQLQHPLALGGEAAFAFAADLFCVCQGCLDAVTVVVSFKGVIGGVHWVGAVRVDMSVII